MMKKNILVISLLFFLNSCGFQPIYSKNNNINFSIDQIDYTGDTELNNFLRINLDRYKNEKINNKIYLKAESKYEKSILSKDSTGKVTSYQLEVEVIFLIKSTNKKIRIIEEKIINNIDDKFEEARNERSIKQSFASSISDKLLSMLVVN